MYSTQVYLYQQITRVLLAQYDDAEYFIYRYSPVYAKKLTINKGVDNVLLFEFVNQEQKPVNITGSTMLFRVISNTQTSLLLEAPVTILNGPTGRAKVVIPKEQLFEVIAQPAGYSIQFNAGPGAPTTAVFVNDEAGARAPVDIVDSVQPYFVPSAPVILPTTQLSSQVSYDGAGYQNFPDWAGQYSQGNPAWNNFQYNNTEFYSSHIQPRAPVTTFQFDLVGYTGTVKAQWAEDYESIWINATESTTYLNQTGTFHLTVYGWYPLMRLCFNNSIYATPTPRGPGQAAIAWAACNNGEVTDIIVTYPGIGYLAPPKVNIVGDGAGATAEAEIDSNGAITNITITNPGSGYWPVPAGGVWNNPQSIPVPPNQQGALVVITTGYVENIFYR